jgi:predicted dithiol-disulfide oxidoreductase (DUF899 family)
MVPFVGGTPNERTEAIMNDQARSPALPRVADRTTWQEAREALFAREKAHTREGDAIAAARRRLPMVEVDATIEVIGPHGPITILDVFEGRRQLIAYFHAWWPGRPAAEQCEGCTFFNCQVRELSYIHSRDATYAALCKGPYEASVRYRDFLGLDMPWYSVEKTAARLLEGGTGSVITSSAMSVTASGCSRRTTPAGAASRSWLPPTGCWT